MIYICNLETDRGLVYVIFMTSLLRSLCGGSGRPEDAQVLFVWRHSQHRL